MEGSITESLRSQNIEPRRCNVPDEATVRKYGAFTFTIYTGPGSIEPMRDFFVNFPNEEDFEQMLQERLGEWAQENVVNNPDGNFWRDKPA